MVFVNALVNGDVGVTHDLPEVYNFAVALSCPVLARIRHCLKWPNLFVEEREADERVPDGIRGASCAGDSIVKCDKVVGESRDLGLNIFQFLVHGCSLPLTSRQSLRTTRPVGTKSERAVWRRARSATKRS